MSQIDLTQLPPPDVVETLDFESIFQAALADFRARDPAYDALTESDPAVMLLQSWAYREGIMRARINDGAEAVMLARATGADLDNLGAFYGVARLVLDPGDPDAVPPIAPTYEADAAFRARIQLAPEGWSTAGPIGAYRFYALSVAGVKDVAVTSPEPGTVLVSVLSNQGWGGPSADLLAAVRTVLSDEDVRPLTDNVVVESAQVGLYSVQATIHLQAGPDPDIVRTNAISRLQEWVDAQHRLGLGVPISGIYGALHAPGVARVQLSHPLSDQPADERSAFFCYEINVGVA